MQIAVQDFRWSRDVNARLPCARKYARCAKSVLGSADTAGGRAAAPAKRRFTPLSSYPLAGKRGHPRPIMLTRPDNISRAKIGLALGFVGMCMFAGTLPATRLAVAGFDPFFLTVIRAAIAGVSGLIVIVLTGRNLPPRSLGSNSSWPHS